MPIADWAAWVSRRTARARFCLRAAGSLPAAAGARLDAADTSVEDPPEPAWPLHAATSTPGTATASAAAISGDQPSRRRLSELLSVNTRASRGRCVGGGHGRLARRPCERNLPGRDG